MIELQTQRRQEYERTILIPLREAVEKAGGRIAVAKKMNIKANALQAILHKTNDMRISTLMKLCSTLNITFVFWEPAPIMVIPKDLKDSETALQFQKILNWDGLDKMIEKECGEIIAACPVCGYEGKPETSLRKHKDK